ncbi:MAG: efflux RND transporter periplasmic adaptor subunit [Prevotellaceae bacterium]|jgi:RND family efflux transporter MFP subunit|nr:efflux RND transporter periplasmic adaptor subunit [Prevotellaceae bacterium]
MKKNLVIASVFLALIAGMAACGGAQTKGKGNGNDSVQAPKVRIMKVSIREVEQNVSFTATVDPESKNSIAPTAPTRIRNIFVEVGDKVSKGQRLVQMDDLNLANLETQLANIRETYRRVSELFAVGGSSQQDLDNAKMQLDVAESNLRNLKENTYLISPVDGVVTARNYDNGDLFNGQIPVLTVMQVNQLKLKINISESYFSKVKKNLGVAVEFDVYKNEKFNGEINLIYPTIDPYTRTFTAEVKLLNKGDKIRPGMFGRVLINFGTENRVVVSDRAIVKQPGSGIRYVYLYKEDGTVSYQEVTLGMRIGDEYEVLSGLNDGDVIVAAGQARLSDGDKVEVIS